MAFSEGELVFLALILIFTLVFLLLGRRNNTSTAKNTKKKRNGRKRAIHQRHCQDHQHKTRRGPDENDDDEPYNPRGTILWWDFVMLLQLIHHYLKYDDWYPSIWDLLIPTKLFCTISRKFWDFKNQEDLQNYQLKAFLLKNISTFYFSRIMWREIFGHVAVHKRLLTRPTEYTSSRNF